MKTKETAFTQTLNVYAIPTDQYTLDINPHADRFYFEVRTGECYSSGAVLAHKEEVSIVVPAGIDLTTKAVETLETAIAQVKENAHMEVTQIQQMINNLLVLEAPKEEEV